LFYEGDEESDEGESFFLAHDEIDVNHEWEFDLIDNGLPCVLLGIDIIIKQLLNKDGFHDRPEEENDFKSNKDPVNLDEEWSTTEVEVSWIKEII
jgi:hypothetical protein